MGGRLIDRVLWRICCRLESLESVLWLWMRPHYVECSYCGHLHHTSESHLPFGHVLSGYCDGCVATFGKMVNYG